MKQLDELAVRDYMTENVIIVDDTARLTEAIRLMDINSISAVPVVDEQGGLVGILSSSDLIEKVYDIQADLGALNHVNSNTREFLIKLLIDQGDNKRVKDAMTTPVTAVKEETNLVVASQKLIDRCIHHLPVVDANLELTGMISTTDIVRAVAEIGALAAG